MEYYVASYEFMKYIPLFGRFTLQLGADLAYGMDIGDTTACRRTGSSTAAVRRRCAATARAAWAPRTTSAVRSAAT